MCNTTKLRYLILLCITEDEFANATMHDENVIFSVYLHKAVRNFFSFNNIKDIRMIMPIIKWRITVLDITLICHLVFTAGFFPLYSGMMNYAD
jgi:hypothetical protein